MSDSNKPWRGDSEGIQPLLDVVRKFLPKYPIYVVDRATLSRAILASDESIENGGDGSVQFNSDGKIVCIKSS